MQRSLSAAALLLLAALAVPCAATPPATPAERALRSRAVEALIRATQATLDRSKAETWRQRSARRSLALSRELLSLGNARAAESMALHAQRVLTQHDGPQVRAWSSPGPTTSRRPT